MPEVAAQYKKQDGRLTVSEDGRTVTWRATSGTPAVEIAVAEIGSVSPQALGPALLGTPLQEKMLTIRVQISNRRPLPLQKPPSKSSSRKHPTKPTPTLSPSHQLPRATINKR